MLAHQLIPRFGWRAVFVAGGTLPLLLVPILFFVLPESPGVRLAKQEGERRRSIRELFTLGRGRATAALNQAGIPAQHAIIIGSLLQVGALLGTLLCGTCSCPPTWWVRRAQIRSTGVGWALGMGRIGSILGPLVAAAAIALFGPWRSKPNTEPY